MTGPMFQIAVEPTETLDDMDQLTKDAVETMDTVSELFQAAQTLQSFLERTKIDDYEIPIVTEIESAAGKIRDEIRTGMMNAMERQIAATLRDFNQTGNPLDSIEYHALCILRQQADMQLADA